MTTEVIFTRDNYMLDHLIVVFKDTDTQVETEIHVPREDVAMNGEALDYDDLIAEALIILGES